MEKKEVQVIMTQYKEGIRPSQISLGANHDVDITHPIPADHIKFSPLRFCSTHAPSHHCTLLYYFATKGHN